MGEGLSSVRMFDVVDAARDAGFVAVSANDHFAFPVPWLDGLTALSAVIERSGDMKLATTLSLPSLRGPVPVAKALAALDVLSGGRVIAGLGPGSSPADYRALGIGFDERWARFDESVAMVKALLAGAYNTTPEAFLDNAAALEAELGRAGRSGDVFPHALVTMWTWVTENRAEADRILAEVLAPFAATRPRGLARKSLCRARTDVRGTAVRLRQGRVSTGALLAYRRRSSTDRVDRNQGDAVRVGMRVPDAWRR